MIKKTILLTAAVMALLAVPGAASAAEWTMGGKAITGTSEIKLLGTVQFTAGLNGGVHCTTAHVTLSADPGNTAHVTEFTETGCTMFGALKTVFECEVGNGGMPIAFNLPWTATAIARGKLVVTGIHILYPTNESCLLGDIEVSDGTNPLVATANNAAAMESVTLSGEVETSIGPATVSGALAVEAPNGGTYGIE
jgi:hypothetical protein